MQIPQGKKVYFLSDFHLGIPDRAASLVREKKIVSFLEQASADAGAVFILGDLFDFWYEYRKVVPKGYVRILGKLAELTDRGIPVHFFVGNHDMWMNGYFESELNIPVFHEPRSYELLGKKFHIGHGDGLGPGDHGYKFIKKIFRNPFSRTLFGLLPPVVGMGIAEMSSRNSRLATGGSDANFLGEDKEWLVTYCKDVLTKEYYDYFIFGHRHLPLDLELPGGSRYINLGDWIRYDSYVAFDGETLMLKFYRPCGI